MEDLATLARDAQIPMRVHFTRVGPIWMDPIVSFLKDGTLAEDRAEANKTQRKVPRYWLSKDQKLYKRSYSGLYLFCIRPEAVEVLLEELHKGICGNPMGGGSLVHRALTQGY